MTYGSNREAVEEIFEFVAKRRCLVLRGELAFIRPEYDLERAKHKAWQTTYGADGFTWSDIRELEVAAVKRDGYVTGHTTEARSAIWRKSRFVLATLRSQLVGAHSVLLDDCFADLMNCALKRALHGRGRGFFEDVFGVYESGGWPCGWEGEYPGEGRLIAYYPRAVQLNCPIRLR